MSHMAHTVILSHMLTRSKNWQMCLNFLRGHYIEGALFRKFQPILRVNPLASELDRVAARCA